MTGDQANLVDHQLFWREGEESGVSKKVNVSKKKKGVRKVRGRLLIVSLCNQHPKEGKGPHKLGFIHSPRRATHKRIRNIKALCDDQEGNKTFCICRNRWRNCKSNLGLKKRSRGKPKRTTEP